MALTVLRSTEETRVNATGAETQVWSKITSFPDGGWLVTWTGTGSSQTEIFQQRYNSAGTAMFTDVDGQPQDRQVNATTLNTQQDQTVTVLEDGGWIVAWTSVGGHDGAGSGIYHQRFDALGNPQYLDEGVPVDRRINSVTAGDQTDAEVTALVGGGWLVTWKSGGDVYQQRYDFNGDAMFVENGVPTDRIVNSSVAGIQENAAVEALADGGWIVTWDHRDSGAAPYTGVYQQRFDADGNPMFLDQGNPVDFQVSTFATDRAGVSKLATLTGGGWIVTWRALGADGTTNIYHQRYDSSGNPLYRDAQGLPEERLVNATLNDSQSFSDVTALDDGGWLITWQSNRSGTGTDILQRRYNADGTTSGPDMVVNNSLWNAQENSSVTSLSDGWVVTWTSNSGPDDFHDIYQRRYTLAENVLTTDTELVLGNHENDTLQVALGGFSQDDQIDGGDGTDTLAMRDAGYLDLTAAKSFTGFEIIQGSVGNDLILTNVERLAGITTVTGNGGTDEIQLTASSSFDLSDMTFADIKIVLASFSGTAVTLTSKANAALLDGTAFLGDSVTLVDDTFTAAERSSLIRRGIETITDESGTYANLAPEMTGMDGDNVTWQPGNGPVTIDEGSDMTVTDEGAFESLLVVLGGFVAGDDRLAIATSAAISLSDGTNVDSVVTVNGVAIGAIARNGRGDDGLMITLNGSATAASVQLLIRALTYDNVNAVDPTAGVRALSIILRDEGGLEASALSTITVDVVNDAPTLGGLSSAVQRGFDTGLLSPFAGAVITDTDTPLLTLTVAMSDPAHGVLTNFTIGSFKNGLYTVQGTAAEVQAALKGLQFDPRDRSDKAGTAERTTFTVSVTDGAATATDSGTVVESVTSNRKPTELALSGTTVAELARDGSEIGAITVSDVNAGEEFVFTLLDDAGGRFAIRDGKVVVKNGVALDFEQSVLHTITIRATDAGNLSVDRAVAIRVSDISPEVTVGSSGNDRIKGGVEKDSLSGGAGDDVLFGGLANDILAGNAGADIFAFDSKLHKAKNVDRIVDFVAKDDAIWLDNSVFTKLGKGSLEKPMKLAAKAFFAGTKANDSSDRIIYDKKAGVVYYDADGTGVVAQVKFATLKKNAALTAKDLFVI